MKLFNCILILLISLTTTISAQTKKELEETYKDANSYFYFEDYEEAVALYLQVYKHQPNNSNLNYRIGFCYLNIPGSKQKAINHLQKAAANTTRIYNEESILETRAPIDAIFYLGNAYFVNNQIDKALEEYKRFTEITKGKGQWNIDYLNHQVSTAKNSAIVQKNPINYLQVNLGEKINDRFANYNAIISGDGKTLAYTTKRRFYQAVFVSTLNSNGEWDTPKNITLDLQVDGNCSTLSLSYDGNELYLYKDDNHNGNIYVSRFRNGKWAPMTILNKNINSEYYETHASVSSDGKYLFFTSNRKGGYGDLDIYVSERSSGDNWGIARNLGSSINTSFNENTAFLTNDGSLLYFSSEGHNNIGGYDVFISQLNSKGEWSTPINIGYPINTPDDDLFFQPIGNGAKGLISIFDNDGFGEQDICEVELFIPKFMKNIVSTTSYSDRTTDRNYKKIVIDTLNEASVAIIDPNYSDLLTKLNPQKKYKLFFEGKSFEIREKPQLTEKLIAKTENIQAKELPQSLTSLDINDSDSLLAEPIQERINILKQFNDTNLRSNLGKGSNLTDTQNNPEKFNNSIKPAIDYNNLSEILLLLTPINSQAFLTKVLKKEWKFDENQLSEKIIEFSNAFESYNEKDAIIVALSVLSDKLNSYNIKLQSNRLKSISTDKKTNSFLYTYNQIVNLSSPELSKLLASTLVNNQEISTIEELIAGFRKHYPEEYKQYLPELLQIIAKTTIEAFIKLPDELKFELYNNLSQTPEEKPTSWWLYIMIAFILVSITGLYIFSRKDKGES